MPLPALLSAWEEAELIAAALREFAQPASGSVEIMANQSHMWEKLFVVTDSPRILVLYAGERLLQPNMPDCRRVERDWEIIVIRGRGFLNPVGGGFQPFPTTLECVRDTIRVLDNISDLEEVPSVIYKGIRPLPNIGSDQLTNAFMDAMMIEFSTHNDIPGIVQNMPGTEDLTGGELPPTIEN